MEKSLLINGWKMSQVPRREGGNPSRRGLDLSPPREKYNGLEVGERGKRGGSEKRPQIMFQTPDQTSFRRGDREGRKFRERLKSAER